jgi:CRISPR/Cas system-associated protein Cas5 (RAMP superfamily)
VGLLSDVKLAMEYTFHTHVPVEYDVIVKAVEIAETEGDLIKRISPIMAIVFTELQLDEEN